MTGGGASSGVTSVAFVFESAQFVLPVNREVELHVTSLDVIHSFWVPALGLKADANPGVDNIAYITPTKTAGHIAYP